ncbi:MAG: hypothetical protein BMS9Abin01_1807 [Gammaproteobacteria bacterium]|nr:MAG: hypothetical protein BMS9Abin01_1807 [Gammaproteobacteria bacterium]
MNDESSARRPSHPYFVMFVAAILPGVGQVLNYQPRRALTFLFFLVVGAWLSRHLTSPDMSFVGRNLGGFFIYAVSVLDAYKWARVRWAVYQFPRDREGPSEAQ